MSEDKIPISVAIITKNEEACLPNCLKSISFADDIVVVDSGSNDKTLEIAKEFECKTFIEEWKGFGLQKDSAVKKCKNNWVLILDADEVMPEDTKKFIINIIQYDNREVDAYSFPRKTYFNDKWIKHCGWWPDRIVRLFKKNKGYVSQSPVHENITVLGKTEQSNNYIIHRPRLDFNSIISKTNLYSSLGAESLFLNNQKSSAFKSFLKSICKFIKIYFLKLGVLDGYEGFVISFSHSVGTCYKYLKLKEMIDSNRTNKC